MSIIELTIATGDTTNVRRFAAHEAISSLFSVSVWAHSENHSIDLEAVVGQPAMLKVMSAYLHVPRVRKWEGICSQIEQVHAEVTREHTTLSTYLLRIVPKLWVLTQKRNYRIFQRKNIPDILDVILGEWGIDYEWKIERGKYPKLEYRCQYAETDFAFFSRLLEEAGIAYTFPDDDKDGSKLVLNDALHQGPVRPGPPLPYVDNPNQSAEREFVTHVRLQHEVRPGAHAIRDYDMRRPAFNLIGEAPKAKAPEDKYEQFHYKPGGFLIEGKGGGDTPTADDKGVYRHEQKFGKERAERALGGERMGKRSLDFQTNAGDFRTGLIFSIDLHPHAEITPGSRLLVTEFSVEGTPVEEWSMSGQAVFADVPYLPPFRTQKPQVVGMQSATVVGPPGQEIHVDEFGRVRVQFPWDREGKNDDYSSCWMRVSQGWAGVGYGMIVIPRIGHEVLIGFLNGDPDQPFVGGRLYNATEQVPYKLPEHKTRSTWKSDTSPGSNGFNEIMYEDLKGKELVWEQAQKNRRRLVKNDEFITVVANRQKLVKANEIRRINASRQVFVGENEDIVIKKVKKERVEGDAHLTIKGKRNQKIEKSQSLQVGEDQQEKVGKKHALEAGREIHLKSGDKLVIEAGQDLTIKGPGGFMRIDAGGVTIKGLMVKINSGGSPGSGSGSSPEDPQDAVEAGPDDVSKTLIGQ